MFELYLHRWDLVPDGEPIVTPTAQLLPVLRQETQPGVSDVPG